MSEYTTIQISNENKEKMELLKGKGIKYDDVLTALLTSYGGAVIEDVEKINRDSIALQLRYWKFNNTGRVKSLGVSFHELKMSGVGTVWVAEDNPVEVGFVNTSAELVYRKGDTVLVCVREFQVDWEGVQSVLESFVHFDLF